MTFLPEAEALAKDIQMDEHCDCDDGCSHRNDYAEFVARLATALKNAYEKWLEDAAKIAENGMMGKRGDPCNCISYDERGDTNAFNTCLLVADKIRAAKGVKP